MKKLFLALLTLVISLLTLTVCNKTTDNNSLLLLLGLTGGGTHFIKTVEFTVSPTTILGPFNESEFRHYQFMYKPADIGGSGNILSIYLRFHENSQAATCRHVTIKLGHIATTVADLNADMTLNINQTKGSAVTVLDDGKVSIPKGAAGEYFEIPFDRQFNYNGVDNLVVDIERTSACSGGVYLKTGEASTAYTGRIYSIDSATPDTATESSTNPLNIKFKFAGGTNNVVNADMTGDNSNTIVAPGHTGRTQMLVLASDINGRGTITGIAFNPDTVTNAAVITGMSVSITELPPTTTSLASIIFNDNYGGATPVVVSRNLAYNVPADQPSTVWIPFVDRNFNYNGKNNLLIDISCMVSSGNYTIDYKNVPNERVLSSDDTAASSGILRARAFEPAFRFAGGTMDTINASNSIATVFPSTASGRQFLLRASELGSAGAITGISLRAYALTTEVEYPNYSITMAHTTQSVLVADDATNIAGGKVVYSGTFTMPAGLLSGDWIEFRFTTPFRYNGYDNLVVQTSSGAGTAGQNCRISTVATTWFDSLWKSTSGGSPVNGRGDFRLWIK